MFMGAAYSCEGWEKLMVWNIAGMNERCGMQLGCVHLICSWRDVRC